MSTIENVLSIALLSAILIALVAFVIMYISHKLRAWDERMLVLQKQQARARHLETMQRGRSLLEPEVDRALGRWEDSLP